KRTRPPSGRAPGRRRQRRRHGRVSSTESRPFMRVTDRLDPLAGQPASDGGHPPLNLLSARAPDAREAPTEYRMPGNSLPRTARAAVQPPIPDGRPAFRRIGFQADPGSAPAHPVGSIACLGRVAGDHGTLAAWRGTGAEPTRALS